MSPTYLTRYYLNPEHKKSWLKSGYFESVGYNPVTGKVVGNKGRAAYRITGRGRLLYYQLKYVPDRYSKNVFSSLIEWFGNEGFLGAPLSKFTRFPRDESTIIFWKDGTDTFLLLTLSLVLHTSLVSARMFAPASERLDDLKPNQKPFEGERRLSRMLEKSGPMTAQTIETVVVKWLAHVGGDSGRLRRLFYHGIIEEERSYPDG